MESYANIRGAVDKLTFPSSDIWMGRRTFRVLYTNKAETIGYDDDSSYMTDIKIIVYSWAELIEDWVTHGKEVSFVIKNIYSKNNHIHK